MVKTPRTRHSKATKEPVTIDLAPGEVARVKAEQENADAVETPPQAEATASAPLAAPDELRDGSTDFGGPGEEPSEAAARDPETPFQSASPGESSSDTAWQAKAGPTAPTEANRRGGIAAPLVAGLAGGALALVLAGGLQVAGLLPGTGAAGPDQGPDIAAIEARIDELQGQVAALSQASGEGAALAQRLTSVEQGVAGLAGDLETLRGELAGLAGAGGEPADLAPLEERIAAIETAIAGIGGAATPEAALAALDKQIETLRGEIGSAREAQAAATARLDALERSVGDLASKLEQQAEAPGTAVIIAASALKAAIDRGGPFMTELETFASLAPDAPEVAELRAMAAAGVPTRAQIAAESDAAANAMIAAARPIDPEGSLLDRLWGSAMGLVQVRPIGMVEGEGVPEIVARIDAAVTSNDYGRAIEEFGTLPNAAKAAGEGFITKVRARHSADSLIDQALAAALKA